MPKFDLSKPIPMMMSILQQLISSEINFVDSLESVFQVEATFVQGSVQWVVWSSNQVTRRATCGYQT